jgi:hypothetical protein
VSSPKRDDGCPPPEIEWCETGELQLVLAAVLVAAVPVAVVEAVLLKSTDVAPDIWGLN